MGGFRLTLPDVCEVKSTTATLDDLLEVMANG